MKGKCKLQLLVCVGKNGFIDLKLVLQRGLQTWAIRNRRLEKTEKGNLGTERRFQCL